MDAQPNTLTPMPDGFYWKPRCHLDTLPTGLFLFGEIVASLHERVDGGWIAHLDLGRDMEAMPVTRSCTSFEAGRRGCEIWALRHQGQLRERVAEKLQWIQDNVVLRGRGKKLDLSHVLGQR